jgi:hypothetical protein
MIKGEFFIIKLFNKYIQDEDNSIFQAKKKLEKEGFSWSGS